jgi:bifunctional UDP-N-acetylglucosamine pyrophosphorylase / glucosamine-1-phosphate N-acetyltransferase
MTDSPAARTCLALVLAAGEGTRMRSAIPKVLHEIAGRSLVGHVLEAVRAAGATRTAVVIGPDREDVGRATRAVVPEAGIYVQAERLGTAHAVLSARAALAEPVDDVVIAFGDTPLVRPETFARLRAPLAEGAAVVVLGFEAADPTGYGRLIGAEGRLAAIREERDATPEERRITLCNAGLMALRGDVALGILEKVDNRNVKHEFYLTDVVEVAARLGMRAATVTAAEEEVQGINDRIQLARAERTFQDRMRRDAMAYGVTLTAPETVYFSYDTRLGRDTVVEPNVVFGPGVTVEENAVIHAFCHLTGARVAAGAEVGPFARLRPGTAIGPKAKIGNFVEIKNAAIGQGAKVNHLSYVGDAIVGPSANIGAGAITCNYDGYGKYRTIIGEGAFVGSNSSLVAPVTIGEGAYVGSGSVVTQDIPGDALGVARARQSVKEGWAKAFRERSLAAKKGR